MPKVMSDGLADRFLLYAFFAWGVSCVHPVLGFLFQFPAIVHLAWKCDVKTLPALLILMFTKSNVSMFAIEGDMAIRLGITWTTGSCLAITVFVLVVRNLLTGRYEQSSFFCGCVWLICAVPAFVISFAAKRNGLSGIWSGPIMAFIVPAIYYWGMSMGRTYALGRGYLAKRLLVVMMIISGLSLARIIRYFTFIPGALVLCLTSYIFRQQQRSWGKFRFLSIIASFITVVAFLFGRRLNMEAAIAEDYSAKDLSDADKIGSTFSAMTTLVCALVFSLAFRRRIGGAVYRILPVALVVFNILMVSYVITLQGGNKAKETSLDYQTFSERFQMKLFGDRGTVWTMGWEDVKTPPLVFKDLRQFIEYSAGGKIRSRLLPHNQFLTLLSRNGLWLGGFLSFFIIWVWVRTMKVMDLLKNDFLVSGVIVPVGLAIYFVLALAGQSVVVSDLWGNSLVTLVLPGVVYGHWRWILLHP